MTGEPMTGKRRVRLHLDNRTISAADGAPGEDLQYAGITILRLEDGEVVETAWIPVGAAPTYADDEALIAAWRAAVCCGRSYAETSTT
jgi:hypothetical protein